MIKDDGIYLRHILEAIHQITTYIKDLDHHKFIQSYSRCSN